jgi:hypothetical protein
MVDLSSSQTAHQFSRPGTPKTFTMQKIWENRVAISTNQPSVCQNRQTVGHDPLTKTFH